MERREFIGKCGLMCAVGISGIGILSTAGCKAADYAISNFEGNKIKILKSDFPIDKQYVLLKNPINEHPIYLRRSGGDYYALLLECTHKGCTVRADNNELKCPCHGSKFSSSGAVTDGPAQKPLKQYPVTQDNSAIYVAIV